MRLSIVISVYQSHEAVRRHVLYWRGLALPEDVEIILVDDHSQPPLQAELSGLKILRSGNTLAWTQGLGRNLGAREATGDYLLLTDIDHILSREAIDCACHFGGDRMLFPRYFGVLDEEGVLRQDLPTLERYGLDVAHLGKRGLYASVHLNTFAIRRATFETLGGYDPARSLYGYHPVSKRGDDCYFNAKWNHWARKHGLQIEMGPPIYMFPNGRYHVRGETNPMGLFHDLSYDGERVMHKGEEHA